MNDWTLRYHKLGFDLSKDFHTWGVEWNEQEIAFLFDGKIWTRGKTPPSMRRSMYLLINLAVGGKWYPKRCHIRASLINRGKWMKPPCRGKWSAIMCAFTNEKNEINPWQTHMQLPQLDTLRFRPAALNYTSENLKNLGQYEKTIYRANSRSRAQ